MTQGKKKKEATHPRFFSLEMLMITIALISASSLLWGLAQPSFPVELIIASGILFTLSLVIVIRLVMDPDNVRARQSDAMLKLSSQTLACMQEGLNEQSAQKICKLLLPSTAATAVAITDREKILGYEGTEKEKNPTGSLIRTQATSLTLKDGQMRILFTPEEIGFPSEATSINAAIIVPLTVSGRVAGTLKFYFRKAKSISETQKSIAEGFGKLLSTQMAASALEQQTKLATSMELKALQSQINPHFLFNTINTIASLVRTNPEHARVLLREFAVFYRRTLEDPADLIPFSREIEQTLRYFTFEVARFGEDRIALDIDMEPFVEDMMIPSFLLQPLIENAVKHALPSEGKLDIEVIGEVQGEDVLVHVKDNGVGMSKETCQNIMQPKSSTGLGIAVGNVNDRIKGHYGPDACMKIESELGKGTIITLVLAGAAKEDLDDEDEN